MRMRVSSPIDFVREVVRNAYWGVDYHKQAMKDAHQNLKWAREIMRRCEVSPEDERAATDKRGDPVGFETLAQFVLNVVDEAEGSLTFHENELALAHNQVAYALILLERGNYTEISLQEIQKQVADQLRD